MEQVKDIKTEQLIDFMNRLKFFNAFSEEEQKEIVTSHTPVYVFNKDEPLIKEGTEDTSFYVLLSGSARVIKDGVSLPIAEFVPGDSFGEISFLTGVPRTSNVIANEVSIVIKVEKDTLANMRIEIREKIKDNIIQNLVIRLSNMNNAFISLLQ